MTQSQAPELQMMLIVASKGDSEFKVAPDGGIRFQNKPDDSKVKREILEEAHKSPYSIHPGTTKMYKDLQRPPDHPARQGY